MSKERPTYQIQWVWQAGSVEEEGPYPDLIRTDGGESDIYQTAESVISSEISRNTDIGDFVFTHFVDRSPGPREISSLNGLFQWVEETAENIQFVEFEDLTESSFRDRLREVLFGWQEDFEVILEELSLAPLQAALTDGADKIIGLVSQIHFSETGVDTVESHTWGEYEHRRRVGTLSNKRDSIEYSGPLYVYAKHYSSNLGQIRWLKRTSPINVVFAIHRFYRFLDTDYPWPPTKIVRSLEDTRWTIPREPSFHRYVIYLEDFSLSSDLDPQLQKTQAEVAKRTWMSQGFHARIFDANVMDNHRSSIAQLHFDTLSHGHLRSRWKFAHSRRLFTEDILNYTDMPSYGTEHIENVYLGNSEPKNEISSSGGVYSQMPSWHLDPM